MTENTLSPTAEAASQQQLSSTVAASAGPAAADQARAGVSETAAVIAALIPALPQETVRDLSRLLRRRLTNVDYRTTRYVRLGLLIDIVSAGTGEVPSTRDYEREREKRAKDGETDWPVHSTLSTAYGGWIRAVRAAMLLWRDGSSSRTASAHHHATFERAYQHEEAAQALRDCHQALGLWPTEWEYDEWRRVSRELARNVGKPYPRYPNRNVWWNLFGSWAALEARAKRIQAETEQEVAT